MDRNQCRAARAYLDWTQAKLAERSGVHVVTIGRYEKGLADMLGSNVATIERTFSAAGITFLDPEDGKGPGLRFNDPRGGAGGG